MGRRSCLAAIVEHGVTAVEDLDRNLPREARDSDSTWERWCPRDAVCHVAEWLLRDLTRLKETTRPLPTTPDEEVDQVNRVIYDRHRDTAWSDALVFFRSVMNECQTYLESLTDEQLDEEIERADGTSRPVWRIIGGHAGFHLSLHFAAVYRRAGMPDDGTAMERLTSRLVGGLDDSDEWQAVTQYNLACNYSFCGDVPMAIRLLREAFRLNPELVEWSRTDPDLENVRSDPGHSALYE
jgi:hypothetical protein